MEVSLPFFPRTKGQQTKSRLFPNPSPDQLKFWHPTIRDPMAKLGSAKYARSDTKIAAR
jgi:hypothetical protein